MIETGVEVTDIIEQLRNSIVSSYDTGESGDTVENIVTDLLAFQTLTPLITVGTIDPTDTIPFSVSDITILAALYQLQEMVGGYISVDTSRALQWDDDIGDDTGQQIRWKKNLTGLTKEVDWGGLFTRIYPKGGDDVVLSDISIGPVDVTASADASYGYLTLLETYACYNGWTGEGHLIPSTMEIYEKSGEPSWVTGTFDSGSGWTNTANGVDDDWDTYTASGPYQYVNQWTIPYVCNIAEGYYGTCKFKVGRAEEGSLYMKYVLIQVYVDESWVSIYYSSIQPGVEIEFDFTGYNITKFRVYGRTSSWQSVLESCWLWIYECQFLQSDLVNVTDDWMQGAAENVVKADIGDYDNGKTYLISYTYADYLKAWDKIDTYGDIAHLESNNNIAYADALLDWASLLLTAGKTPVVSYDLQALMLSELGANFDFEELELGSIVNVIDEELNIDVDARVVKIDYKDLNDPLQATVEISNRVEDITDTFNRIFKKL